jgi:photosystem II stability/assembly factor-like uncharacterized protein
MKTLNRISLIAASLLLVGQGCIQVTGSKPSATDGGVFRSADRGAVWVQKSSLAVVGQARTFGGVNVTTLALDPTDKKAVYAGTEDAGLFFSYDGAESWQHASGLGRVRVTAVAVSPADKCTVFAATGNKVMRTTDCSRTWENVYFDPRPDTRVTSVKVDFFNAVTVYAATNQGDFLRSGDGGGSWSPIHRFENEIRQVLMASSDSRTLYVVTKSKGLWKSTDAGATWTDLAPGFGDFAGSLDQMILAEDVSKPGTLVAASNYGLLKSEDAGATWKAIPLLTPPGSTVIYSLAVSPKDSNAIWYGTVNTLYRTSDGGAKWTTTRLPTTRAATTLLVDPTNDSTLYMGTTLFKQQQGLGF